MSVRLSKLGDEATIVMGQSPPGDSYNREGKGTPLLNGPTEFGSFHPTEEQWTTSPTKLCQPDDVLFCVRGATAGRLNIADKEFCLGRGLAAIRAKRGRFDGAFLRRVLSRGYQTFQERGVGSTFINISREELTNFAVPAFSFTEQRRIAAILDRADELRAQRRAAMEQLEGLTQEIFFEMFGDPITNPRRFATKPLGSLTSKIGSGATPLGGDAAYKLEGIALIRSMNVRDGFFLPKDLARIDGQQAAKLSYVEVLPNDVLLNITGASVARVCRVPDAILPARVNQHVSILRTCILLLPAFLERLLLFPSMKKKLLQMGDSGGATRQAITKGQLEELDVILPTVSDQRHFAERQLAIERITRQQSEFVGQTDCLFESLQHRAFAGTL